jgi:XTP/dITP diphosphohydrolase
MKSLLIATTNPAKLAEYRLLLSSFELKLISPDEAGIRDTPAETGATFTDNALLKARHYFARSGLPTLADDGGLEVDALGGAPGLKSHRWLGEGRSGDQALADEVIRRMNGVEENRRSARLRAAIALVYRENCAIRERVAEAAIEGVIARRAYSRIRPGFPYRSVMFLPERGRYLAELGDEEEARIGQRRIALEKLRAELERIAGMRPTPAANRT